MYDTTYVKACEILGIPDDSSLVDIKTRWKQLNKKYHTDLNPNVDDSFVKEINWAWDYIKNNYHIYANQNTSKVNEERSDSKDFKKQNANDENNINIQHNEAGNDNHRNKKNIFVAIIVLIFEIAIVFAIIAGLIMLIALYFDKYNIFTLVEDYFDRIFENIEMFIDTFR